MVVYLLTVPPFPRPCYSFSCSCKVASLPRELVSWSRVICCFGDGLSRLSPLSPTGSQDYPESLWKCVHSQDTG